MDAQIRVLALIDQIETSVVNHQPMAVILHQLSTSREEVRRMFDDEAANVVAGKKICTIFNNQPHRKVIIIIVIPTALPSLAVLSWDKISSNTADTTCTTLSVIKFQFINNKSFP